MQVEGTPRYYRVKAVAEMFDVSPSTVYRAIEAGELDAVRIGGSLRIPARAVAAFEESAAVTGPAALGRTTNSSKADRGATGDKYDRFATHVFGTKVGA